VSADQNEIRKAIYAEAKSAGSDTKALKAVVTLRKRDKGEREAHEALVQSYLEALGDLADLPLGRAAMQRDGIVPPV
jgi:uncharacterized protein (UPF0335 family)